MSPLDGQGGYLMPGASEQSQRVKVLNANWIPAADNGALVVCDSLNASSSARVLRLHGCGTAAGLE
jgi:hypothetical protein